MPLAPPPDLPVARRLDRHPRQPRRPKQQGRPASVGYLLAALAVGSAVGGLLWGRLSTLRGPRVELAALAVVSAAAGFALVDRGGPGLALLAAALG